MQGLFAGGAGVRVEGVGEALKHPLVVDLCARFHHSPGEAESIFAENLALP